MTFRKGAYFFLDKTFLEYVPRGSNWGIPRESFINKPLGTICIQDYMGTDSWRMHIRVSMDDLDEPYGGTAGWRHSVDVSDFEHLGIPPEIKAQMLLIG